MSILLTDKEILEVSWGEPDDLSLTAENLQAGLQAIAREQLRKVFEEIDVLWDYASVRAWLDKVWEELE